MARKELVMERIMRFSKKDATGHLSAGLLDSPSKRH
jgi:hypothetical protein